MAYRREHRGEAPASSAATPAKSELLHDYIAAAAENKETAARMAALASVIELVEQRRVAVGVDAVTNAEAIRNLVAQRIENLTMGLKGHHSVGTFEEIILVARLGCLAVLTFDESAAPDTNAGRAMDIASTIGDYLVTSIAGCVEQDVATSDDDTAAFLTPRVMDLLTVLCAFSANEELLTGPDGRPAVETIAAVLDEHPGINAGSVSIEVVLALVRYVAMFAKADSRAAVTAVELTSRCAIASVSADMAIDVLNAIDLLQEADAEPSTVKRLIDTIPWDRINTTRGVEVNDAHEHKERLLRGEVVEAPLHVKFETDLPLWYSSKRHLIAEVDLETAFAQAVYGSVRRVLTGRGPKAHALSKVVMYFVGALEATDFPAERGYTHNKKERDAQHRKHQRDAKRNADRDFKANAMRR